LRLLFCLLCVANFAVDLAFGSGPFSGLSSFLGWAELHPRPSALVTDLGWAGLEYIVIVGWAGLSCTHSRQCLSRTWAVWAWLGLYIVIYRYLGQGWAELHPLLSALVMDLGWAGLIVIVGWAGLSCSHGRQRLSQIWAWLGLSFSRT
jgi:hypothetical protein